MDLDRQTTSIARIFLVGFMGAGKTTVGKLLAQRLGWSFLDLDDRIVERERREIAEVFQQSGEEYFRKIESECLRELMQETQGPSTLRRNTGDASLGMTQLKGLRASRGPSTRPKSGRSLGMTAEQFGSAEVDSGRSLRMTAAEGLVVALGGGAFVRAENAALLRQSGAPVIFLDAGVEELRRRCQLGGAERPLFRDENQFRQLYEARRSAYMAADLRVDTGGKTPEQVVEELLALSS